MVRKFKDDKNIKDFKQDLSPLFRELFEGLKSKRRRTRITSYHVNVFCKHRKIN